MLGFSETAFDMAATLSPEVDREVLQQAIRWITAQHFIARQERQTFDLGDYFERALDKLGVENELRKQYRSALGTYFNRQRQRRSWSRQLPSRLGSSTMPAQRVEEVKRTTVRIRASLSTSIVFRIIHNEKKVEWHDLVEHMRVYHFDYPLPSVSDSEFAYAKTQAVAVFQSRRRSKT